MEWPHPIRSELLVESLKRPKPAAHNEWLGTILMTRIKMTLLPVAKVLLGLLCKINKLHNWHFKYNYNYLPPCMGDLNL